MRRPGGRGNRRPALSQKIVGSRGKKKPEKASGNFPFQAAWADNADRDCPRFLRHLIGCNELVRTEG